MVSITLSLPEELRKIMKQYDEINWSALVRKVIEKKVQELKLKEEMFNELDEQERFSQESIRIGNNIKESLWKKYKKEGW